MLLETTVFAPLLLQKQNEGGTYSLIADPELLIDPLLFLLLLIRIAIDAAGILLRGVAAAAAVFAVAATAATADRSSAVVATAGVKIIDPECCC